MGFETGGGEGYKPKNHRHEWDGEVNKMRGINRERYVPKEEKQRGYYSMKGKEMVLFQKAEHTDRRIPWEERNEREKQMKTTKKNQKQI